MTWPMACNLLTGLLVLVHRWATMFCRICNMSWARDFITSLLEIALLYSVSQDQTVCCEIRQSVSRLDSLSCTKFCPACLVPQLLCEGCYAFGPACLKKTHLQDLHKIVWQQEIWLEKCCKTQEDKPAESSEASPLCVESLRISASKWAFTVVFWVLGYSRRFTIEANLVALSTLSPN